MGSAELVLSEINLRGAIAVSRRIDSDENFGRSVLSGIATGDSSWLEVAQRITPATSAAEASLAISLATALSHAPGRVLRLLGDKYPLQEVCGIPFLRADSAGVVSYYRAPKSWRRFTGGCAGRLPGFPSGGAREAPRADQPCLPHEEQTGRTKTRGEKKSGRADTTRYSQRHYLVRLTHCGTTRCFAWAT